MLVNRVSGLVAPAFAQVFVRQRDRQASGVPVAAHRAGGCRRDDLAGHDFLLAHAAAFEIVPANDHGAAHCGAGAYRAAAGIVLRREQDGRACFADHERRRGRAQSDRHGSGGFRRRNRHGNSGAGLSLARQRLDDRGGIRGGRDFRPWAEQSVQDDSPDVSRAPEDQRRGDRPPDGIAWRRARREGLPR